MKVLQILLLVSVAAVLLLDNTALAQNDCSEIRIIDSIQMFVMGDLLYIVWQEPSNMLICGFTGLQHRVTYTGYETEQEIITSNYYAYFEYSPYSCVPSVITILAYTDTLTSGEARAEFYEESSKVENLELSETDAGELRASWSEPPQSEMCNFIYRVNYSNGNMTVEFDTSDLEALLNKSPISCVEASVTVTPINGNYVGIAASVIKEGAIGPVRNYQLTVAEGEILAVFDPPLNIDSCEITYEVKETELDCFKRNVDVAATNGRIYSPWLSNTIEVEVDAVKNLAASKHEDNIVVSWDEPENAIGCDITYQVNYNDEEHTSDTPSIILYTPLTACVESVITVRGVSPSGVLGATSELKLSGEINAVEDIYLSISENGLTAGWNTPGNAWACTLSYLLEFRNEGGVHWFVTSETNYEFEYASCDVDVTLTVTPHGEDGSEGPAASYTLPATC